VLGNLAIGVTHALSLLGRPEIAKQVRQVRGNLPLTPVLPCLCGCAEW
jgi:hypothetical protein